MKLLFFFLITCTKPNSLKMTEARYRINCVYSSTKIQPQYLLPCQVILGDINSVQIVRDNSDVIVVVIAFISKVRRHRVFVNV